MIDRPALVIVCGAPGTGKTTLARRLARELGIAILTKDDLKERFADELGAGDRERSRELGRMAYAALYERARALLAAGTPVLIEANFYRERSGPALRELAALASARIIVCVCDEGLRRRRFTERGVRGERHAVHLDAEILANEWTEDVSQFAIDLGAPRLIVDTTSGFETDLPAILRFARHPLE